MKSGCSNKRGFSLVEILITVAILSTLLMIGVPLYMGNIRAARTSEAKTNLQSLALLLEQRRADSGTYCPATAINYTYIENSDGSVASQTIVTNFLTGFRPKLGATGAALLYKYTVTCPAAGSNNTFLITATPENGRGAPAGNLTLTETGVKSGW